MNRKFGQAAKSAMFGSAAAKLLGLPISAMVVLLQSRLIISYGGPELFAIVATIWSTISLIPFADFGIGVEVTNSVALRKRRYGRAIALIHIVAGIRILVVIAALAVCISTVILVCARALLPTVPNFNSLGGYLAAILLYAASIPLALWQRILVGMGRNTVVQLIFIVASPVSLLVVWVARQFSTPEIMTTGPVFGGIVVALLGFLILFRQARGYGEIRRLLRVASLRRVRLWSTAGPMFLILLVQPLALQTDRYFLFVQSGPAQVASYSLASQVYVPGLAVLSAAATVLWPRLVQVKESVVDTRRIMQIDGGLLVGLGALIALSVASLGPIAARLAGGRLVATPLELFIAFAVLLLVQALVMPFAMMLTDAKGLRLQAFAVIGMTVVKLGLMAIFARHGALAGPATSMIAIAAVQLPILVSFGYRTRLALSRSAESPTKPTAPRPEKTDVC